MAACSGDTSGSAFSTEVGRWPLRTVNGTRPPAVYSTTPTLKIEIMDGVVHLHADGTYADSTEVRRTESTGTRQITDVSRGNYVRAGSTISFTSSRGEEYSMTLTETSLLQDLAGVRFIYRR